MFYRVTLFLWNFVVNPRLTTGQSEDLGSDTTYVFISLAYFTGS